MGRDQQAIEFARCLHNGVIGGRRFSGNNVEGGAGKPFLSQCPKERALIDQPAPGRVEEKGPGFNPGEALLGLELLCL
jgi:hypothetical protein